MAILPRSRRLFPGTSLWCLLVLFLALSVPLAHAGGAQPRYVFLFIGDGMALAQRSAAEYYTAAAQGADRPGPVKLAMSQMPVQGATTTYSLNSIITDSGAAGTALACGVKTHNGGIGVDGQDRPVRSMAELARDKGWKVGVVTSVSLDHATPASFYAHQSTRNNYYEIALDLAGSGFHYFAGGGFKDPAGKKSKKTGDKENALAAIQFNGFTVLDTRERILAQKPGVSRVVAINPVRDEEEALPYAVDRQEQGLSLAEFTAKGIELLDNPKGFFLMVEGGKIDWACHANDAVAAIQDTLALDAAVREALAFAGRHPRETLVVVTGDHETGGMALGFAGTRYGNYYEYLKHQKESFLSFSRRVQEYRKAHTAENARLEDLGGLIAEQFGLVLPTPADLEAMKNPPKATEDDTSPKDRYGMHLKAFEVQTLRQALADSMAMDPKKSPADPAHYLRYGRYEPLAVALTHILDQKAGVGWTTFSHSGMPVLTSATGAGAEAFAGYCDNTDLARRMMALIGGGQRQAAD